MSPLAQARISLRRVSCQIRVSNGKRRRGFRSWRSAERSGHPMAIPVLQGGSNACRNQRRQLRRLPTHDRAFRAHANLGAALEFEIPKSHIKQPPPSCQVRCQVFAGCCFRHRLTATSPCRKRRLRPTHHHLLGPGSPIPSRYELDSIGSRCEEVLMRPQSMHSRLSRQPTSHHWACGARTVR